MADNMPRVRPRLALNYITLVGIPLSVLFVILSLGSKFPGATAGSNPGPLPAISNTVQSSATQGLQNTGILLAQICVIMLLSRALGAAAERIRQPRVIGEIVAGILLGPSILGWLTPGPSTFLFPSPSFAVLNSLSQLGLVLFMFMVGLELNMKAVRRLGEVAVLVSHASIIAPMAFGAALGLYLYPRLSNPTVSFEAFALFMGAAMSVTAFPVLARILSERNLLGSRIGSMAIACAAVDDVTGWCVLAYIVGAVRATHSSIPVWVSLCGLAGFLAVMIGGIRRLFGKIWDSCKKDGDLPDSLKVGLLLLLFLSALTTDVIGLHMLFGAFIAGAVMPKDRAFVSRITAKFEPLTVLVLLPLFFAYTGLRTRIGQVRGLGMWGFCLLIIAVAVIGKIGGTSVAARVSGMRWRDSLALGALMNTRGLMELVVLNIGLDLGVISPALFSMMVVMAIVTTMMAAPVLRWAQVYSTDHQATLLQSEV
ncbi:MAG TPA: cation:proton antiporter [Blastocatellia bacterium]|nr:cation:proton antiporter [Blastocatellia bacterium]